MSKQSPSLTIEPSAEEAYVRITSRSELSNDLRRLAIGFRTSRLRSKTSFDVELDDLITNLRVLSSWPSPSPNDVVWETSLKRLVIDSVKDAEAVAENLAAPNDPKPDIGEPLEELLGARWIGNLTEFQKRDIRKLLQLRHGANFSVPGAGKTRVALAVFHAMQNRQGIKKLLVVGPKSSYDSWCEENSKCLSSPYKIAVLETAIEKSADILLVNYERLPGLVPKLGRWLSEATSMIILDEAHRMKLGAQGAYGAACLALGPRADRRLILTGTPAPNGVRDLENLFGFVWPGTGRQNVIRAVGGGDLAAASQSLKPLFTRTTKDELQLPPVDISARRIRLTPLHLEIYNALVGQFSARASGQESDFQSLGKILMYMLMAATSPALLSVGSTKHEPLEYQVPPLQIPVGSTLFQLMQDLPAYEMSPKYQETLAIVSHNAALGRKTLVWSTFVRSLNTLQRILGRFSPAMVSGGTLDRDAQLKRFRDDSDCMVLLSNPATLGEGISLHHDCHDAVYVDRDFAAGRFMQSLDRIHRLGLPEDVVTRITVLTAEDTLDEVVATRLEDKLRFMGGILDDPGVQQLAYLDEEPSIASDINSEDVRALMGHLHANST